MDVLIHPGTVLNAYGVLHTLRTTFSILIVWKYEYSDAVLDLKNLATKKHANEVELFILHGKELTYNPIYGHFSKVEKCYRE